MHGPRGSRRTAFAIAALALLAVAAGCSDGGNDDRQAAQPTRIGILRAVTPPDQEPQRVLLAELAKAGYKGDRLTVYADDQTDVHPDPADAEAVARSWEKQGVDIILALSTGSARAAAKGAPDTPILFLANDPVAAGLLKNERAPEGRLTGVTFRVPADRTLDVARRVIPALNTIGLLYPSKDPAADSARENASRAAATLRLTLNGAAFDSDDGVGPAIETLRAGGAQTILLANAPTTVRSFPAIKAAAAAARLPVIANTTAEFALAVLSPDTNELYRQIARQLLRLLDGASPSDVPVEDPAQFVLTVNAAVAQSLGIVLDERALADATIIR